MNASPPLRLYGSITPNVQKVVIGLAEWQLEYELFLVNLWKGELQTPDLFLVSGRLGCSDVVQDEAADAQLSFRRMAQVAAQLRCDDLRNMLVLGDCIDEVRVKVAKGEAVLSGKHRSLLPAQIGRAHV